MVDVVDLRNKSIFGVGIRRVEDLRKRAADCCWYLMTVLLVLLWLDDSVMVEMCDD